MSKYRVVLVRDEVLDFKETTAKNKKEAISKVYETFSKFDLDDYDRLEVERL